jgi:Tfp pilus assembly protein PilF
MKQVLIIAFLLTGATSWAQNSNVQSAAIYLRNLEMDDAKKAIDAATIHEDTKDDAQTWYYRALIYDTIHRNPEYEALDKDATEKFAIACKKCVDLDAAQNKKPKYAYYCKDLGMINSAFSCYNKALGYYSQKDYANANKFFKYVMDVIPYDKDRVLEKNNITDKVIILTMADMAMRSNNKAEAKARLQQLIDMDYNDYQIYLLMSNLNLEEGDTAKALQFVDMGRKKFSDVKDLIVQEMIIYQAQHKTDLLLKKYNEALELDPENTLFLFNRGSMYDMVGSDAIKLSAHYSDTAAKLTRKAKTEKVPANKTKLEAAAKRYNAWSDSLAKVSADYAVKSEADYQKALEVNPDYLDAYFNLGGLYNNKASVYAEKMNAIPYGSPGYDTKYNALKKVHDSLLNVSVNHFNKALELAEGMPEDTQDKKSVKNGTMRDILASLQTVYANLGDEKKTMETKKRKDELGR